MSPSSRENIKTKPRVGVNCASNVADYLQRLASDLVILSQSDNITGLSLTQAWTTANSLDTKVELEDQLAKGLKAEVLSNYSPAKQAYGGKLNLYYKQPNLHLRTFFDVFKGPTANIDAVLGHEGFLVGGETGYDVQKAAVTKYSAAIGYSLPEYAATIHATNNLSVFAASYYHKVNSQVEAGAKATWDSKAGNNVGLELASKYKLDPSSFAKVSIFLYCPRQAEAENVRLLTDCLIHQAKINDRGIAAMAYNVKLSTGVTLGLGASFDTQNMSQAAHKVGASFSFEG